MEGKQLFRLKDLSLVSASWELERVIGTPSSVSIQINYFAGSHNPKQEPTEAYGQTETKILFVDKHTEEDIGEIRLRHVADYKINFELTPTEEPSDDMMLLIKDSIAVLSGAIRMDVMDIMKKAGARTPFILTPQEVDEKMSKFGDSGLSRFHKTTNVGGAHPRVKKVKKDSPERSRTKRVTTEK
ncbi:hypothetical protein [Deinococcus planocerae]|uniref:hypothetical protein n=1 Tax=Deinococcus planocerae TaxID=1737569 RepID=UPI0011AF265D|nr:hypothetical protein [Deinococcus planocerae]